MWPSLATHQSQLRAYPLHTICCYGSSHSTRLPLWSPLPLPDPAVHQHCTDQAPGQGLQGCSTADAAAPHRNACHRLPPGWCGPADGGYDGTPCWLPPASAAARVPPSAAVGCPPPCRWGGGHGAPCRLPHDLHTASTRDCWCCSCHWHQCSTRVRCKRYMRCRVAVGVLEWGSASLLLFGSPAGSLSLHSASQGLPLEHHEMATGWEAGLAVSLVRQHSAFMSTGVL
jgi:hypothetical protein